MEKEKEKKDVDAACLPFVPVAFSCEADELTIVRAALTCFDAKDVALRVDRVSPFLMALATPRFPATR